MLGFYSQSRLIEATQESCFVLIWHMHDMDLENDTDILHILVKYGLRWFHSGK